MRIIRYFIILFIIILFYFWSLGDTLLFFGNYFIRTKAFGLAYVCYTMAVKADKKNPEAWKAFGSLHNLPSGYFGYVDEEKAKEAYLKAIELDPEDDDAYCEVSYFFSVEGKNYEAIKYLKKAMEINENNFDACEYLAVQYEVICDYKNSLKQFEICKRLAIEQNEVRNYDKIMSKIKELQKEQEDELKKGNCPNEKLFSPIKN